MSKIIIGTVYVSHTCRNKSCGAGFLDTDDNNAKDHPPTNKYCPECKAKGFKNVRDVRGKNGAENLRRYYEQRNRQLAANADQKEQSA